MTIDSRQMPTDKPLRFGIFCRVSTPRQGEKGESLEVQRDRSTKEVERYGGILIKEYVGQESARKKIDERRLVQEIFDDIERGKINALMVRDGNRWMRNMETHTQALKFMRKHGVEFCDWNHRYNLNSARDRMMLNIQASVAEGDADVDLEASRDSKLRKARRGFAVCGTPPFGRTVVGENADGTARWGKDAEAQRLMEEARRHLEANKSFRHVATLLSANHDIKLNAETLRDRVYSAGSKWTQTYRFEDRPVETITIEIPALISDESIERIKALADERRLCGRPPAADTEVLRQRLRCAKCGSLLTVWRPAKLGRAYVRHWGNEAHERCFTQSLRYDQIERSFLLTSGELLRDKKALRDAAEAYFTKRDNRIPELQEQVAAKAAELAKVQKRHAGFVQSLSLIGRAEGETAESIKREIRKYDLLIPTLRNEIEALRLQLAKTERPAELDAQVDALLRLLAARGTRTPVHWNAANKRAWVEGMFGTQSLKGKTDIGIYFWVAKDGATRWEAAGLFGVFSSWAEPTNDSLNAAAVFRNAIPDMQQHDIPRKPTADDYIRQRKTAKGTVLKLSAAYARRW